MMITASLALAFLAAGPAGSVEEVDVAFEELAAGQNAAAIRQIEDNDNLRSDDPARLVNLGVAHAREGDLEAARAYFRAAMFSDDRQMLETASGEWVDSRVLARQALARIDAGRFDDQPRMAAR